MINNLTSLGNELKMLFSFIGSLIICSLGGWNKSLLTLTFFIAVELLIGLLKGFCGKSEKSENGGISSKVMRQGFIKKFLIYVYVAIGHFLDGYIGIDFCRESICIYFIINELISITENIGILGVPIPTIVNKCIDILKDKESKINE